MQLLPRDEKFFDLLVDQGRIVLDASSLLNQGLASDFNGTAQKIRELENKGDLALRNINRRLHKTFITPIDPEDLHLLSSRIDEVLDHLEAFAYRYEAFDIADSPDGLPEIAGMVHECIKSMVEALEALERDGVQKVDSLTARCEAINRREFDAETRVRELVRDLFKNERDPIALIKKKELYELLESTSDCCENVADILENIAVKNS